MTYDVCSKPRVKFELEQNLTEMVFESGAGAALFISDTVSSSYVNLINPYAAKGNICRLPYADSVAPGPGFTKYSSLLTHSTKKSDSN